ncbi:hypothetical protein NQ166_11245 [Microbacterium sp. zg.Y1090]|uniref:hypothetical protein n=1 Tax=Microbacterium TaxID=33882 RepID=UPI00214A8BEE|nr:MULTISPECIES: hypothetical protein [unclassified Microbacterium]MCR2813083.1 hypothetical protein [Microbacterium sp. zg.Y1084]MCR2819397.1 hypothetical protein [Microbacterium sp. zg.Y1090]WIM28376.1 hypothetical protein QNO26_00315 [Microbacterium sp. zg-Y1090]
MESVLLVMESWWWIAPAAAGAGAIGYGALTTGRRRARRLELDAARHEELLAFRARQAARARVRAAQADVLSAKARDGIASLSPMSEARRALQAAKRAEKQAMLELRASRSRVKAVRAGYSAAGRSAPLPLERLMAEHDAVTARWLEYETDAARALAFPQMLESRHPYTLAFLQAQRDAHALRPASARDRMSPETFVAYRRAVRALEAAFATAERDAQRAARANLPGVGGRSAAPGVTGSGTRPAVGATGATGATHGATPGAPASRSAPVWPVPSRSPRPSPGGERPASGGETPR